MKVLSISSGANWSRLSMSLLKSSLPWAAEQVDTHTNSNTPTHPHTHTHTHTHTPTNTKHTNTSKQAKQSKAKQSKAKQSKAKQSKAKQSKAKQSKAKQASTHTHHMSHEQHDLYGRCIIWSWFPQRWMTIRELTPCHRVSEPWQGDPG